MKGILLAGGAGTRLAPLTKTLTKHLLPIYDKPMIYYPLSMLMRLGIRDILIISTPEDQELYQNLFGDGSQLGIKVTYEIQKEPKGIADAFRVGESFIDGHPVVLILGDNLFYGDNLIPDVKRAYDNTKGATIFGYEVENPRAFGVVEYEDGKVLSLEEKPKEPKSNYAVPGLYFYDASVVAKSYEIKPSKRGELEITAVNNCYLDDKELYVELLGPEVKWFDTGTFEGLLDASIYIKNLKDQGIVVGCVEQVAYEEGYIDKEQVEILYNQNPSATYNEYLSAIIQS